VQFIRRHWGGGNDAQVVFSRRKGGQAEGYEQEVSTRRRYRSGTNLVPMRLAKVFHLTQ
jgi:hypothetical protein